MVGAGMGIAPSGQTGHAVIVLVYEHLGQYFIAALFCIWQKRFSGNHVESIPVVCCALQPEAAETRLSKNRLAMPVCASPTNQPSLN